MNQKLKKKDFTQYIKQIVRTNIKLKITKNVILLVTIMTSRIAHRLQVCMAAANLYMALLTARRNFNRHIRSRKGLQPPAEPENGTNFIDPGR
jgi:hypothetical protein